MMTAITAPTTVEIAKPNSVTYIYSFVSAQKAMWAKCFLQNDNASWCAYPLTLYEKLAGKHSFNCSLTVTENVHKLPELYWQILKS
jgi:hypothetical protein